MPSRAATWLAPTQTRPPDQAPAPPTWSAASRTVAGRPRSATPSPVARPERPAPTTRTCPSSEPVPMRTPSGRGWGSDAAQRLGAVPARSRIGHPAVQPPDLGCRAVDLEEVSERRTGVVEGERGAALRPPGHHGGPAECREPPLLRREVT